MAEQEKLREDAIIITKDQLWREGIRDEQRLSIGAALIVDGIFHHLNHKDVVIKVERELPERMFLAGYGYIQGHQLQVLLDKIGCGAVESLIGEEK